MRNGPGTNGQTGRRLSRAAGRPPAMEDRQSLAEAVDGSDFLLCSIGGAGATGASGYYESPAHLGDKLILPPGTDAADRRRHRRTGGDDGRIAQRADLPRDLPRDRARAPGHSAQPRQSDGRTCRAMNKSAQFLPCVIGICHGVQAGIRHAAGILGVPAASWKPCGSAPTTTTGSRACGTRGRT